MWIRWRLGPSIPETSTTSHQGHHPSSCYRHPRSSSTCSCLVCFRRWASFTSTVYIHEPRRCTSAVVRSSCSSWTWPSSTIRSSQASASSYPSIVCASCLPNFSTSQPHPPSSFLPSPPLSALSCLPPTISLLGRTWRQSTIASRPTYSLAASGAQLPCTSGTLPSRSSSVQSKSSPHPSLFFRSKAQGRTHSTSLDQVPQDTTSRCQSRSFLHGSRYAPSNKGGSNG